MIPIKVKRESVDEEDADDLQKLILDTNRSLLSIWKSFNYSEKEITTRQLKFRKHIQNLCCEMKQSEAEELENARKELDQLTFDANELQQNLGCSDTSFLESTLQKLELDEDLSLVERIKKLLQIKDRLMKEKNLLLKTYDLLLQEVNALSHEITETEPDLRRFKDMPIKQKIEELKNIKTELEETKLERVIRIQHLQKAINRALVQFDKKPEALKNPRILKPKFAPPTKNTIKELEDLKSDLLDEVDSMKSMATNIFAKLQDAWKLLETGDEIVSNFTFYYKCPAYPIATVIPKLESELQRCMEEKAEKMDLILSRLGEDLKSLWELCCYDPSQRARFQSTLDVLTVDEKVTAHEKEIERLRIHSQVNQEIFISVRKYSTFWEKWTEFEVNAGQDPQRLENRGGYLLAEEKKRKELLRTIRSLEKSILSAVKNYKSCSEESSAEMLIYGKTVNDWFKMLSDNLDLQKAKEKPKIANRSNYKESTLPVATRKRNLSPSTSSINRSGLYRSATWGPVGKRERAADDPESTINSSRVLPTRNMSLLKYRSGGVPAKGPQVKPSGSGNASRRLPGRRKSDRHSIATPEKIRKNDLKRTVQLKFKPMHFKLPKVDTTDLEFSKLSGNNNDVRGKNSSGIFVFGGPAHTSTPLVGKIPSGTIVRESHFDVVPESDETLV